MRTLRVIDSITELGPADEAGVAALDWLARQGLAACTVEHLSARIGDAQSTLNDGIISRVNPQAAVLGVAAGQGCRQVAAHAQNFEGDSP